MRNILEKIKEKFESIKERREAKKRVNFVLVNDPASDKPRHHGLSRSRRILITIFFVLIVGGLVAGTTRTITVNKEVEKYRKTVADAREEDFSPKDVDDLSDAAVNKLVKEAVDWGFVSKADSKKLTDKEKRNVAKAYASTMPKGTANYTPNDLRKMGYGAIKEAHDPRTQIKQPKTETESVLITFKDYDDSLLSIRIYRKDSQISLPTAPKRKSDGVYEYKFKEWTPKVQTKAKKDATYMAVYVETEIATGKETVLEPTPIPDPGDVSEVKDPEDKTVIDPEALADDLIDKIKGEDKEDPFPPTEEIVEAGTDAGKSELTDKAIQVKDVVLKNDLSETVKDVAQKVHDSKANIQLKEDPQNNKKYYIVDNDEGKRLATLKFLDMPETVLMRGDVESVTELLNGENTDDANELALALGDKFSGNDKETEPYALYTTLPEFGAEDVYFPGGKTATFHEKDGGFSLNGPVEYVSSQIGSIADDIVVYIKAAIAAIVAAIMAVVAGIIYLVVGLFSLILFIIMLPFIAAAVNSR